MVRATKWAVGALVDARCTAEALVGFVAERVRAPNRAPGGIWQDQIVGMLPFLVVFQVPTSAISNVWLGFGCRGERGGECRPSSPPVPPPTPRSAATPLPREAYRLCPACHGRGSKSGRYADCPRPLPIPACLPPLPPRLPPLPPRLPARPPLYDPSLISPSGSPDPAALHSPLRIPIMAVTCRSPSLRCHRPLPCHPGATRAARAPPRRRRPPRWPPQSRPPPS